MVHLRLALPVFGLFLLIAVLPSACYYDNRTELYGDDAANCDTVALQYSADVLQILQNNCYSCHSQSSNIAGFPFDTYNQLKSYADNGTLVNRINSVSSPMPPSGLMSLCDRLKIEAWVRDGAKNN